MLQLPRGMWRPSPPWPGAPVNTPDLLGRHPLHWVRPLPSALSFLLFSLVCPCFAPVLHSLLHFPPRGQPRRPVHGASAGCASPSAPEPSGLLHAQYLLHAHYLLHEFSTCCLFQVPKYLLHVQTCSVHVLLRAAAQLTASSPAYCMPCLPPAPPKRSLARAAPALCQAASEGHTAAVEALAAAGADVNAKYSGEGAPCPWLFFVFLHLPTGTPRRPVLGSTLA